MDDSLTPVQKHQYLIGMVQGETRTVIQRFKKFLTKITSGSY